MIVTGQVFDQFSNTSLPSVNVTNLRTGVVVQTNITEGKFSIVALPTDMLRFTYIGYVKQDILAMTLNQRGGKVVLQTENHGIAPVDVTVVKKKTNILPYIIGGVIFGAIFFGAKKVKQIREVKM